MSKKTVLIGGITGGIGSQLAEQMRKADWNVYGYARNAEGDQQFKADATNPDDLSSVIEKVLDDAGQIDAYAHCIGSIFVRGLLQTSAKDFETTLQQNLWTSFHALKAVAEPMCKNSDGRVVLLGTAAARAGLPGHEAIAAAKAGVEGLAQATAASYASRGLRVNVVAPGLVETPLAKPLISSEKAREISEQMHPLGTIGKPEEIASLIAWLLSDQAQWVTGQVWAMDGGLSTLRGRPKA